MTKDLLLRTLLYVPGGSPGLLAGADVYGADCLVLDLEDSIPLSEKDSARILVRNFLAARDLLFPRTPHLMVRVNHLATGFGAEDIRVAVAAGCRFLRIPKVESPADLRDVEGEVASAERSSGLPEGEVRLFGILETARGVEAALAIAEASPRLEGLTLGAEDLTRDLGTERTRDGEELAYARGRILSACRAAGILAIDTVFPDVNDGEGLLAETRRIKALGFDGKSVIHPRQIEPVHAVFRPSGREIAHALRVEAAMREAREAGRGAIALDGRMVDTPVVKKAERVLRYARRLGLAGTGETR